MLRKMLDDVADRFEDGHVVALWRNAIGELVRREAADDIDGLGDRRFDKLRQFGGRHAAACVEFGVAFAVVGQSRHARTDPLPYVSRKMQHKIADRVLVFRAARPDLVGCEPCQAILNAAVQLLEGIGRKLEEDFLRGHAIYNTSSDQFSRIDLTLPVN